MSSSQMIVIPYTEADSLPAILQNVIGSAENTGASIKLVRIIEGDEHSGLDAKLYAEFKALQASVQNYNCRLTIELLPKKQSKTSPTA